MTDNLFAKETLPISLEEEMRRSYLDYAMSVIVGRALPDVRDGLKPVHRRVLYAMHELSNDWNRAYKKSARIVGDVIGKYHPHGDTAVYDTIVRLAQDFSLRYPLVDGQGNFGSVDGDNAAAMRYTEIRMARIAHELLADIEKETVDFGPNYDGSEHEPLILPAKIPNLLVNGSSGIAVGMATNIPPHNLNEVVDACLALLANSDLTIDELIDIIPAPDFPTAGIIYGTAGVKEGYRTGRGRVIMRARTHTEPIGKGDREAIIVDEIPYQVNKARLLERISELVRDKQIEGISDLRDESDKSGMRVVIELKRGEMPEVVLNHLFKMTQLQDSFGMNMVALVDGQPRLLNLKQILEEFLRHRREVVTRRTIFELKKARERGHILEGLAVALSNVDEIIALIKASEAPPQAKAALMARAWRSSLVEDMLSRVEGDKARPENIDPAFGMKEDGYHLSDTQAQAILDMRLQRLTGLEQDKIVGEYREIMDVILDLLDILAKPERISQIIGEELTAIRAQFGDPRRSEIEPYGGDINIEDLITPQDMVVTISHTGYIKAQPIDDYSSQRRGGRGKQAAATKDDDFIETLFVANTHDYVLCFSSRGRCYWRKVYDLPQGGRQSRGKPMVNVLPLEEGEKINALLPVKEFRDDQFVFMCTANGTVKKTPLVDFSRPRTAGIIAVNLDDGDNLIGVALTHGDDQIMLFSDAGKAVRFSETDVRPMGRNATGVRGMMLGDDHQVISLLVSNSEQQMVLTASDGGYGKRTCVGDFRRTSRGTQGVIAMDLTDKTGLKLVAASLVEETDDIMLITTGGVLIRTKVAEVRETGRSAQGVRLINLDEGEKLIGLEIVAESEAEAECAEGETEGGDAPEQGEA
ncbi:DNA gyrase subunit A [Chromobacterium violaceum]|uniref:DNA gyrase subunit A n=1 Tax=Chromobacterium violaceum TaxID=536 RepID=A0AAX2M9H3_CHRVL|nr:DNA gyrase subunit A [Chromobacterium violaceum]OLZ74895.1 DNA gyrase subunit A [Chromobacterium violaceum]STB63663.1 DNA gyrase subunit A [Chromobacterium violaceum]SUX32551.1 DNA gyrase subunit A [Chromobacterium violaceum]